MSFLPRFLVVLALSLVALVKPATAGATDPLFVNLTSDDGHRAAMAISFGRNQLDRGHPLTIFLNDKGVNVGSKAKSGKFPEQQKMIADVVAKGGTVLMCPMCMKHYGIKEDDLLPGIKIGNPDLTGPELFKDGTKTLSW